MTEEPSEGQIEALRITTMCHIAGTPQTAKEIAELLGIDPFIANKVLKHVCFDGPGTDGKWSLSDSGRLRMKKYKLKPVATPKSKEAESETPGTDTIEANPRLMEILKDPDLLQIINREFSKKIVGENDTRLVIFIISCGRLMTNADPTSTNLLVNDESGMGKDYVTRNVLLIWPVGIVQHKKRISPKVFTYWHNSKSEPEWTWDDKIFYGEDTPNSVLNSDPFKLIASAERGKLNKSVILINQSPVDIGVMGKPVVIITMANSSPKGELLRRFPAVELDSSVDQTRAIVERQGDFKQDGIAPRFDSDVTAALGQLKPVAVAIPFAKKLSKLIVCEHPIIRTNFTRFCDIIGFSAALHQYQRERDTSGKVLANAQDFEIGRKVIMKITSNKRTVPVTKKQKMVLEALKDPKQPKCTVKTLLAKAPFISGRQLYREVETLTENGFLKRDTRIEYSSVNMQGEPCGTKREVTTYEIVPSQLFTFPTWEELQNLDNNGNNDNDDKHDNNVNQHTETIDIIDIVDSEKRALHFDKKLLEPVYTPIGFKETKP